MSASAINWSKSYTARRDLQVRASEDRRPTICWNVLDPLTRQSYRIGELEREVLQVLNGSRTLTQVLKILRRRTQFATLSEQQLLSTVEHLQRSALVRSQRGANSSQGSSGEAEGPTAGARAQTLLSSFVVWQVRGLHPDAWLAKVAPYTNAIFSTAAVRIWIALALLTGCGVFLDFQRMASQSVSWQWVMHPVQGTALFAVFLATRALHELGHAIVCKRHGARCPDVGLFLILGAPCVYCDVSESWQLPTRWQRAAVAAAGMYVELIVATIAAWVWLITIAGPVNTVALQTMFVCSVSTVLINANPLMRFDGYYILSDILDEANLRAKADGIAELRLYRWILGKRAVPSAKTGSGTYDHLLCAFSWTGWFYRAGMSLAIAGLLVTLYESWQVAWIGRLLAVLILFSWWGVPTMKLAKNALRAARKTKTTLRLALVTGLLAVCIALLPVPYRQFASGWVQPAHMQGIYASANGTLEAIPRMPSRSHVENGEPLFRIHDVRTEQEAVRTEGLQLTAERHFHAQKLSIHLSGNHNADLESAKSAMNSATQQAAHARRQLEKLLIKAPCEGRLVIMPSAAPTGPWSLQVSSLKVAWDSATQLGACVTAGTMLAAICDSGSTAVIPLSDKQLEWVATGTEVRVRLAEQMETVHHCRVHSVVLLSEAPATWRLINRDLNGENQESDGASQPGSTTAAYAALVVLPKEVSVSAGTRIDGVFVVPSQTLLTLGYRWLQQNLRWLAD